MTASGLSKTGIERVGECLRRHVDARNASGAAVLICRHGDAHVEVAGARADGGRAVERDTIFRIASMTKPVTAVAFLSLLEDNVLRLDDAIDDLIPEFANPRVLRTIDSEVDDTVAANRSITARDLVTFTFGSGLVFADVPVIRAWAVNGFVIGPPAPANEPTTDEWIARFASIPLMYQPGERWLYNMGSEVLTVLMERATGQRLGDIFRERIFEPLGMKDTGFSVPADKLDRFTTAYTWDYQTFDAPIELDKPDGQWSSEPKFMSGGGGLVSTVDDYNAFASMLLNNGIHDGERVVSRPSVELMTSDQLSPAQRAIGGFSPDQWQNESWGFGVSVVTTKTNIHSSVGTYGWSGGLGSVWQNDPAEDMTVILLTNQAFKNPMLPDIALDLATTAYAAIDD